MPDREVGQNVCSACPVNIGTCPTCGTFWWTRGDGKRYGMRPATEQDAATIRALQTRHGYTAYPVYWDELPNAIGPMPL
jgi:hypothetical protein